MKRLLALCGALAAAACSHPQPLALEKQQREPLDVCLGVDPRPDTGRVAAAYQAYFRGDPHPAAPLFGAADPCAPRRCMSKPTWRDVSPAEVGAAWCSASGRYVAFSVGHCGRSQVRELPCGHVVIDTSTRRVVKYLPVHLERNVDGGEGLGPDFVGEHLVTRVPGGGYAILSGEGFGGEEVRLPYRPIAKADAWLVLRDENGEIGLGVAQPPSWTSPRWQELGLARIDMAVSATVLEGGAVVVVDDEGSYGTGAAVIATSDARLLAPSEVGGARVALDPAKRFVVTSRIARQEQGSTVIEHALVRRDATVARAATTIGAPSIGNTESAVSNALYAYSCQPPGEGIRIDLFSLAPFALRRTVRPFGTAPYYNPTLDLLGKTLVVIAVDATQTNAVQYRFAVVDTDRGVVMKTGVAKLTEPAIEEGGARMAIGAMPGEDGAPGAWVFASDGSVTRVASEYRNELAPYPALPGFHVRWAARARCEGAAQSAAQAGMRVMDGVMFPKEGASPACE